jgi:hypothetical protein
MNALNKIAEMEAKLAALEKIAMGMPKMVQDFQRLSDDVKQITKACENLITVINKRTGDLAQVDNIIITRQMALEQSLASLSKTAAAMVAELSETKVLNQEAVMLRMRKSDEELDKQRVEKMIEQKVLKEAETITNDSFIVVSQEFTYADGKVDVVAEFRSYDMTNPELDEDTKKNYVGKRKNDTVELNLEDGVLRTTVLQVYDYVQVYAESNGEDQAKDESQPQANQQ